MKALRNTPIGPLPTDWSVEALGDIFAVSAGGDWDARNSVKARDANHPYAVVANALTAGAVQGYCSYYTVRGDTLTITGRGDVGHSVYRDEPYVPIVRLLSLIPKRNASAEFFSDYINECVRFSLESTGVPQLTAPQIRPYLLAVPPLSEQLAIADALRSANSSIVTLERLIAKKQAIKQGMMQQLLTGRTRLPGYIGEWRPTKLGAVALMRSGGTPLSSVSKFYGGGIPWVSISDMTRAGKYITNTENSLTTEGIASSPAKLYESNSVLYAMYASIGECSLAVGPMASSQAILGINPGSELEREFLYYWLQYRKPQVKLLGQQGTQSNLNAGMVRDFDLELPDLDEQVAIAGALADCDAELAALDRRLAKTRDIKTGMMQQLLTGRTRLPVEAES